MVRRRPGCRLGHDQHAECGQATVEAAIVLPLLFALVLAVVQVGLVARDQVLLVHAAREAARAAALDPGASASSSGPLQGDRLLIELERSGGIVTAVGRYRSPVVIPLLRGARPDVPLSASVAMRIESEEGQA